MVELNCFAGTSFHQIRCGICCCKIRDLVATLAFPEFNVIGSTGPQFSGLLGFLFSLYFCFFPSGWLVCGRLRKLRRNITGFPLFPSLSVPLTAQRDTFPISH
ncbi:hypothetical protein BDV23DRAFT_165104 [Aspergillus alliaceus]|uniref:Uncharacterized protein n=1 Tax=Petromyces alliaceus TaxID=209559 RepID=A0A5N7BUI0_PETAA|nr:hypothetical protein BDV23DRAFT_165104 [Aspergillus alliaceus]